MKVVDAVRKIAPHCNAVYLRAFEQGEQNFVKFQITTPQRQSQFIGQFGGETNGGQVLFESGNYKTVARLMQIFGIGRHSAKITESEAAHIVSISSIEEKEKVLFERVYGAGNPHKMNELGNRPGDGYPFRGAGPGQSTGRGDAKEWGDKLGVDFSNHPELRADARYCLLPMLYEWDRGKLNRYADVGDIRSIRRIWNGGFNGLADCEDWQEKAWAVLRDPDKHPVESWAGYHPDPSTSTVQNCLNLLGYLDENGKPLKVDGKYGPATKKAVVWFQTINKLDPDGIAGPLTIAAINMRFATLH